MGGAGCCLKRRVDSLPGPERRGAEEVRHAARRRQAPMAEVGQLPQRASLGDHVRLGVRGEEGVVGRHGDAHHDDAGTGRDGVHPTAGEKEAAWGQCAEGIASSVVLDGVAVDEACEGGEKGEVAVGDDRLAGGEDGAGEEAEEGGPDLRGAGG